MKSARLRVPQAMPLGNSQSKNANRTNEQGANILNVKQPISKHYIAVGLSLLTLQP